MPWSTFSSEFFLSHMNFWFYRKITQLQWQRAQKLLSLTPSMWKLLWDVPRLMRTLTSLRKLFLVWTGCPCSVLFCYQCCRIYAQADLRQSAAVSNLSFSVADMKKALELDPSNKAARASIIRLEPIVAKKREELKDEMIGKMDCQFKSELLCLSPVGFFPLMKLLSC